VADSRAFEFVCGELERRTQLSRLEARGTVRLALKDAGLDAATVRVREMLVVLKRLLPAALESRGIASAEALCGEISAGVAGVQDDAAADTPDAVFKRLANG